MPPPRPLKKLELGGKRLVFGALRMYLQSRPVPPMPDWTTGPRRVLFLRQDRLGDAIVSTGLLRAIASLSPELELDVLASPRNAEILRRLPYIRQVHLFDKRKPSSFPALWRALRRRRYDVVIDCMVTAPSLTGLLLMLASRAPHRLGVGGRGVDWGLTVPVHPTGGHIIRLYSEFIRPFGVEPESLDWRPELELSEEERVWGEARWPEGGLRVLVNVSAGEPRRNWPDDRYAEVLRMLRDVQPSLALLVIGAPGEWARVARLAAGVGVQAIPTPRIENLLALIATSDLVFTPDTSVVHVASAFGKPVAAMYIEGTSEPWGPYGVDSAVVEGRGETLATLQSSRVIGALGGLLARVLGPDGWSPKAHGHERSHHHHQSGHRATEHMNRRPFEEMVASFDSPDREEWQKYDEVVRWLGDLQGQRVMDLGSGTGNFAFKLLEAGAKVIAADTDDRFLEVIRGRASQSELGQNLEIRRIQPDSPGLGSGEVDLVLLVNVYHHLHERLGYFRDVRQGLGRKGRVVVIEFNADAPVGPPPEMKIEASAVAGELEAAGFDVLRIDRETLPYQYLVEAKVNHRDPEVIV